MLGVGNRRRNVMRQSLRACIACTTNANVYGQLCLRMVGMENADQVHRITRHLQAAARLHRSAFCRHPAPQYGRPESRRSRMPLSITIPKARLHGIRLNWAKGKRDSSSIISRLAPYLQPFVVTRIHHFLLIKMFSNLGSRILIL